MAGKDNAIEFTEVKYTSRKEMSNELGISVPEEMWNRIVAYRAPFNVSTSLLDVENRNLFLCQYPTLASRVNSIANKLNRFKEEAERLSDNDPFRNSVLSNNISALALKNNFKIDLPRIKKLLVSENPFDNEEEQLLNYYSALQYIESNCDKPIDVDFLADLYSKVTGIDELTYFYRTSNINDISSMALVSRVYNSAPVDKIEMMMDGLFSFLQESKLPTLHKALTTLYYISYVKPFKDYNDEIAILIAKSVLAHVAYGKSAAMIPFEKVLFSLRPEVLRKMNQEVIQTADVTYYVSPMALRVDQFVDDLFDIVKDYSIKVIRNDFYRIDEEAPAKKEETPVVEEKPAPTIKVEEKKPEPIKEETIELFPEEPVEEIPVVEEKKEEKAPAKESKKEEPKVEPGPIAFGYIPSKIDEKEAQRLEEHLLELDYRLKKGEAKFYARHCTLGMYYTIEQYRKCVKCVYETARTSMEHLAELGYYNKQQVGKKFVYTPVNKK